MARFPFRPRLTLSQQMGAIAVFGVLLAGGLSVARNWPRVIERRQQTRIHFFEARRWTGHANLAAQGRCGVMRQVIAPFQRAQPDHFDRSGKYFYLCVDPHIPSIGTPVELTEEGRELAAICRERAVYHDRMARKWSRAVWLPWIDVAPDPLIPPVEVQITNFSY